MESLIAAIAVGVIVGGVSTWIAHKFERENRREIRQELRDRDLREMIETSMRVARAQSSGLREFQMAPTLLGISAEEVRRNHIEYIRDIKATYPKFFWRPHRIKDEGLKTLASELQQANSDASLLIYDRWRGGALSPDDWDKEALGTAARIDDLLEKLDHRLDELEW